MSLASRMLPPDAAHWFGTVPAVVAQVSRDAVQDEKRGPVYAVRITLEQPVLQVDGRAVPLTPGLSGSAEIRTGDRRLIEIGVAARLRAHRQHVTRAQGSRPDRREHVIAA